MMKMVVITEKRYRELLKRENRNKEEEIKTILKLWYMLYGHAKDPDDYKGFSINLIIQGLEHELKELEEERI